VNLVTGFFHHQMSGIPHHPQPIKHSMAQDTDLISGFDESDLNKLIAASGAGTASQIQDILGEGMAPGLRVGPGAAGGLFGFPVTPPVAPNPALPEIVLLHGITDCHLANTAGGHRNRIWLDFVELFKGSFIRNLPLQADGTSDQPGVSLEPDGHVAKKYDRALAAWTAAGFRNRVFCYDWRRSVTTAADHLHSTLSNLPSVKAGEKVVLVAHSMGGLVAAAFAARKADWESLVQHCIFIGSPLGGSYSVPMTVLGHSPSFQQMDRLSILDSLEDFQRMAASFPGLIDMLPNPDVMPEAADFYTEAGWPGPVKPSQALLDASRALKNVVWESPIFAKSSHIISQGHSTTSAMPWNEAGTDRASNLASREGDGAALTKSSLAPGLKVYLASGEHGTLVNEPRIHNAIIALATGGTPDLPVFDPSAAAPTTGGAAALALPPGLPVTVVPVGLAIPGIPAGDRAKVALVREIRLGDEMALHFSSEAAVRARTQISGEPGFDRAKLADEGNFWANSLSLAIASLDAYRSDQAVMATRAKQDWGFTGYESFEKSENQGFICWDDKVVVLAFRGSEKKISDWLGNLSVLPRETGRYGSVHSGFYNGYKAVEADIRGILGKAGADSKKLWITGHSLGGALSSIAGIELFDDFRPHGFATYGQPMLASPALVKFYQDNYASTYWRFKNNNDIVTRIPPGYDHVGKLYWFNGNGELKSSASAGALSLPPEVVEASATLGNAEFAAMQAALKAVNTPTAGGLSLPLADYQVEGLSLIPSLGISDHSIGGKYIPIIRKHANP
jgi:triacylglycerol lipase